eukprot:COSAG02_NODE_39329_length_418_cov_1.018809_1_plen_32_part_10
MELMNTDWRGVYSGYALVHTLGIRTYSKRFVY